MTDNAAKETIRCSCERWPERDPRCPIHACSNRVRSLPESDPAAHENPDGPLLLADLRWRDRLRLDAHREAAVNATSHRVHGGPRVA